MTLNPIDSSFSDDDLRELFSGDVPPRKQIGYYLDENTSAAVTMVELQTANIYVTTAAVRGFEQEDSDVVLLSDARSIGCVLVTHDRGYKLIAEKLGRLEGVRHAGIMLFSRRYPPGRIVETLLRYAEKSDDASTFYNQIIEFGF